MSVEIKLDRTYDDIFSSLGYALITCTILVSIGKLITYYYFFYIFSFSLSIIISLIIYDYYTYKVTPTKFKEERKEQYICASNLLTFTKNAIEGRVHAFRQATSLNSYSISNDKELGLRRRAWTNKEDKTFLKAMNIIQKHVSMLTPLTKKQRGYLLEENCSQKNTPINKSLEKDGRLRKIEGFSRLQRRFREKMCTHDSSMTKEEKRTMGNRKLGVSTT